MKANELFEKASGKIVYVKTAMDRKEYLASGYYVETLRESIAGGQEIEDAEFVEIKDEDVAEAGDVFESAKAELYLESDDAVEEKSLEDMSVPELQEVHKELYGKKKAGAVTAETLIALIKDKQEESAEQ